MLENTRLLNYVWAFFNIMHKKAKIPILELQFLQFIILA